MTLEAFFLEPRLGVKMLSLSWGVPTNEKNVALGVRGLGSGYDSLSCVRTGEDYRAHPKGEPKPLMQHSEVSATHVSPHHLLPKQRCQIALASGP